jgi:hypothetical protein
LAVFAVGVFLFEVVGRHAEHLEPLAVVRLVGRFQPFELRGEAAIAGGIDHHQRLAGKALAQVDLLLATQFGQAALQQCRAISGPT